MMRKLKNNTASPVVLPDTGDTVPASGELIINPLDWGKYEGSADVVLYLSDQAISVTVSTLTANDGTFDLDISNGVRMIQGGFFRPIADGTDPQILAKVTSYGVLVTDPIDAGTAMPFDGVETTTPGVEQELLTFTVAALKEQILAQIKITCSWSGPWVAYADGDIIASGIVTSGHQESIFPFFPRRILPAATVFSLKFTSRTGPATEVYYHVGTSEF